MSSLVVLAVISIALYGWYITCAHRRVSLVTGTHVDLRAAVIRFIYYHHTLLSDDEIDTLIDHVCRVPKFTLYLTRTELYSYNVFELNQPVDRLAYEVKGSKPIDYQGRFTFSIDHRPVVVNEVGMERELTAAIASVLYGPKTGVLRISFDQDGMVITKNP